jgi:light-regulated signal transduction histidine kinase (bacteriophytochrome)
MAGMMENLLGNAWKFTSRVADAAIGMEMVGHGGGEQIFVVRDNGDGFDMAHSGQLFKPFQRLHRHDEFPGTGIGLATVHRIAARHGGRVWAESAPGKGCSIFFSVPSA